MKKKIKWSKLWKEFNSWTENPNTKCTKCGKNTKYFPSWTLQRAWIQERIEEMLK